MATPITAKLIKEARLWIPGDERLRDRAVYPHHEGVSEHDVLRAFYRAAERYFPGEYTLEQSLEELRRACFAQIDERSSALINAGFTFEGIVFSMSTNAQARYLDMKMDPEGYPYPLPINSLDDTQVLLLQDPTHTRAFCEAAKNHILAAVASGTVQKNIVRDELNTPEQLRAYQDPRQAPENPPTEPGIQAVAAEVSSDQDGEPPQP